MSAAASAQHSPKAQALSRLSPQMRMRSADHHGTVRAVAVGHNNLAVGGSART